MFKPYKVVKVGYGPNLEKKMYSGNKGIRYVDIMDRNTGYHYIYPGYLTLGYAFADMDEKLKSVYNSSITDEDEDDSSFLTVDEFFNYDD